jgi:hypothetical protein
MTKTNAIEEEEAAPNIAAANCGAVNGSAPSQELEERISPTGPRKARPDDRLRRHPPLHVGRSRLADPPLLTSRSDRTVVLES